MHPAPRSVAGWRYPRPAQLDRARLDPAQLAALRPAGASTNKTLVWLLRGTGATLPQYHPRTAAVNFQ
jgi:hypothetical protein